MWMDDNRTAAHEDCEHCLTIDPQSKIGYQSPRIRVRSIYDAESISLLRLNDPSVAGLYWEYFKDYPTDAFCPLKKSRVAIAESKYLRKLRISLYSWERVPADRLTLFFTQMANNRSIEHFQVVGSIKAESDGQEGATFDIYKILAPFFMHNRSLRCIEITKSKISSSMLSYFTAALSQSEIRRLERIDLSDCNIGSLQVADMINTLITMPGLHSNLSDLCLGGNMVGKRGCVALCKLLLSKPECKIRHLDLRYGHLDDACISMLAQTFDQNRTLKIKSLNLKCQDLVTSMGWRAFSFYLSRPQCVLEEMWIGGNRFSDESAIFLGEMLSLNKTLKFLDLCSVELFPRGCRGISKCLRSTTSAILELYLDELHEPINDRGAIIVFNALSRNSSVKKFSMTRNECITPSGWTTCFDMLVDSKSQLEYMDFSSNNIDDEGAAALAEVLAMGMTTVHDLYLEQIDHITGVGWSAFADVMQSNSSSKLKQLHLGTHSELIDDGNTILRRFANALIANTSLEYLTVSFDQMPEESWSALANTLCDSTSIETICYHSNHTLNDIESNMDEERTDEIDSLLRMNKGRNKAEVVREKILHFHLSDIDNVVQAFGSMGTSTFPHGIEWIGRDRLGFSAMFYLFRSMPWLINAGTGHVDAYFTYEPSRKLQKIN